MCPTGSSEFRSCTAVGLLAGQGFDGACASILSQRVGRDVFIVGAANVGKSAFVRRMLREMATMGSRHFDMKAVVAKKLLPVESAMPGTTLGRVPLGAFSSGGTLYDTPGACLSLHDYDCHHHTYVLSKRCHGLPSKRHSRCPGIDL
jgi:ribosome biogenesis GTPase A